MNKVVVVIVNSLTEAYITRINYSYVVFLLPRFVRPQRYIELLRLYSFAAAFSCKMPYFLAIVTLRSFPVLCSLRFALSLSFLAPFRALESYVEFYYVRVAPVTVPSSPAIRIVS